MSKSLSVFQSYATEFTDDSCGLVAYAFSLPEDKLLLCANGEVGVCLTLAEQQTVRSQQSWTMLLLARGMLQPAASHVAEFLCFQQQRLTLSDKEQSLPLIETTQNQ